MQSQPRSEDRTSTELRKILAGEETVATPVSVEIETDTTGKPYSEYSLDSLEVVAEKASEFLRNNKSHRYWLFYLKKYAYILRLIRIKKDNPDPVVQNVLELLVYS